jgi:hypothetical protein
MTRLIGTEKAIRGSSPFRFYANPGGSFRHCDRVAVGGNARDNAG